MDKKAFVIALCLLISFSESKLLISFGHTVGDVKDEYVGNSSDTSEIKLRSPFPFGNDNWIRAFSVSPNGEIATSSGINIEAYWKTFDRDLTSTEVYRRSSLSAKDIKKVSKTVSGEKGEEYVANPLLTFVVTWIKNRKNMSKDNFQVILTSNGIQSYVIYGYGNLEKHKQKIEVGYHISSDNTSCLLPAYDAENSIQLTCRSNVNIPGIFVVGVTRDSKFQCDASSIQHHCSHCHNEETWKYKVCSNIYNPRCATDGITYKNKCEVEKMICKSEGSLQIEHEGACRNVSSYEMAPIISVDMYPYGSSAGDSLLSSGDDVSFNVLQNVPFFSPNSNNIFISSNGHLTYDSDSSYSHFNFPYNKPIIAIYHADLDTNQGGSIFYRKSTDTSILKRIDVDVARYQGYINPESSNFKSNMAVLVTFDAVASYGTQSDTNTFQLVIATNGRENYGIFLYKKLQKESAVVGFGEDSINYLEFPLSKTTSSKDLVSSSNVNEPGKYVYKLSKALFDCDHVHVNQSFGINSINKAYQSVPSMFFTQAVSGSEASVSHIQDYKITRENVTLSIASMKMSELTTFDIHFMAVKGGITNDNNFQYGKFMLPSFSSNTQCYTHSFVHTMSTLPVVILNAEVKQQPFLLAGFVSLWIKSVSRHGFRACAKEIVSFSGARNITISFLAVTSSQNLVSEIRTVNLGYSGNNNKTFTTNSSLCQHVKFSNAYVKPPYVFVTPETNYNLPEGESISWVSKITHVDVIVCSKIWFNSTLKINFVAKGDVRNCPSHLQFHVNANATGICRCKMCSNQRTHDLKSNRVCGSDGVTYDSKCKMYKQHCEKHGMKALPLKVAHMGECAKLNYQTGVSKLAKVTGNQNIFCKHILLRDGSFYSDKHIHMLLTPSWDSPYLQNDVHDATAAWSRNVSVDGFIACVLATGRHPANSLSSPNVNWIAYQTYNASDQLESGLLRLPTWTTGSQCEFLNLTNFSSGNTNIFAGIQEAESQSFTNAMNVWVEHEFSSLSRVRVCARELQNFDGVHKGINIHWLAVHDMSIFDSSHINETVFKIDQPTSKQASICKDITIGQAVSDNATIILTPKSNTGLYQSSHFSNHDISSWVESSSNGKATVCVKSIQLKQHPADVHLSYAAFFSKNSSANASGPYSMDEDDASNVFLEHGLNEEEMSVQCHDVTSTSINVLWHIPKDGRSYRIEKKMGKGYVEHTLSTHTGDVGWKRLKPGTDYTFVLSSREKENEKFKMDKSVICRTLDK